MAQHDDVQRTAEAVARRSAALSATETYEVTVYVIGLLRTERSAVE